MSIKKIQPGPGQPAIIVRRGRPLNTDVCPGCSGTTVEATNAKGQKVQKCKRCGAESTSIKF